MATIRATEDKLIATTAYESKLDIVDSEVAKVRGKHFSDIDGHYPSMYTDGMCCTHSDHII